MRTAQAAGVDKLVWNARQGGIVSRPLFKPFQPGGFVRCRRRETSWQANPIDPWFKTQAAVRPGGDRAQYARCPGRRPARIEKSKIDALGRHEFAVIRHLGLRHALST